MVEKWPKVVEEHLVLGTDGYIHLCQMIVWPNGKAERQDICTYLKTEKEYLKMRGAM